MTLKKLRESKKIKQKIIVEKLNLSVGCVCNWEKGKRQPQIEQIPKLAEVLNCTIEEVVLALIEAQKQNLHKRGLNRE